MFEQSKGHDVWAHFMNGPEPYQASKQTIQNQSLLKKIQANWLMDRTQRPFYERSFAHTYHHSKYRTFTNAFKRKKIHVQNNNKSD